MRGCGEAEVSSSSSSVKREELDEDVLSLLAASSSSSSPSAPPLEGRAGGAGVTGWADGDVIRVRWEAGVRGRVRASVRGQRGRGHGQAPGRLRPQCCRSWCCYCCHRRWHHLKRQRLHIRVASSSENLPLLIKRGGLKQGEPGTLRLDPVSLQIQQQRARLNMEDQERLARYSLMCVTGQSVEGLTKVKTVIKLFTITQFF